MSFITLAQAISSVVGGVPVIPAGAMTVIEKLRAAKSMMPGDMGGMLGQVLSNGPGALLQNPMGAITGALQGQVGNLVSQISGGGFDLGGVMSALTSGGGLQAALGNLSQVTNALSGMGNPLEGGFGLLDAIGHANITSMLGGNLPASLGLDKAMAPLMMADQVSSMVSQFEGISTALLSGNLNELDAVFAIQDMTSTIDQTLRISDRAFSMVQNQAVNIAQVSALASLVSTGHEGMAPYADMILKPTAKAQIKAASDEQLRPTDPDEEFNPQ